MGTDKNGRTKDETADKHCLHPELKRGKKGETVCSSCGRIVYLPSPSKKKALVEMPHPDQEK